MASHRTAGPPGLVRWLVRGLLTGYFRRIDCFHGDRIPRTGPVLFVANHPGSMTDAFVIGRTVGRTVHFVATVSLFRSRPVAWLLSRCGVIPVNRRQDDPTKMATVAKTFEACFHVLESGGAVGLFPEGVSYDDSRLRAIKTGAARLALGIEAHHGGRLGLRIVPIGLTYSARERFRSTVLLNIGDPIDPAPHLDDYGRDDQQAVRDLTAEIDAAIRALILDTPTREHDRIVAAVQGLYLERLRGDEAIVTGPMPAGAEHLLLSQAIASALAYFEREDAGRVSAFVLDLDRYQRWLRQLRLSDRAVDRFRTGSGAAARLVWVGTMAVATPVAIVGWLHHLLPAWVVGQAVRRFTPPEQRRAQTPLAVMLAGFVGLGVSYPAYFALVAAWQGPWTALAYVAGLPAAGLVGHHYLKALRRSGGRLRTAGLLLQRPIARRTLTAMRERLVATLETFDADYRAAMARQNAAGSPGR